MINAIKRLTMIAMFASSMLFIGNCSIVEGILADAGIDLGGGGTDYTVGNGECEFWVGETNTNSPNDCLVAVCGNGNCEVDKSENSQSCYQDCGQQTVGGTCGNGVCEFSQGETGTSCASDCAGSVGGYCGDLICDVAAGENSSCSQDCLATGYCSDGICQGNMGENAGWCADCGSNATCGDFTCDSGEAGWCADCGPVIYCGDGLCQAENGENSSWCGDCGQALGYCGDTTCDAGEAGWCADCGTVNVCGDAICAADGSEDYWCYDGAAGALCAPSGAAYCGDTVCAADGSENGWCYDCNAAFGYCGDNICASDGVEDGWCYDNDADNNGSAGTICAIVGYCGDTTCAADGSEDGWCMDCVVPVTQVVDDPITTHDLLNYGDTIVVNVAVTGGQTYTVTWEDSYDEAAASTYTGDVWVDILDADGINYLGGGDSGYTYPVVVTPVTTGNMQIVINAFYSAGTVGLLIASGDTTGSAAVCGYTDILYNPTNCTSTGYSVGSGYTTLTLASAESQLLLLSVTPGTPYTITFEDSLDQAGSTYTSDVWVDVYETDGVTLTYVDGADSGYTTPLVVTPTQALLFIEVNGYYSAGTVAIQVQ